MPILRKKDRTNLAATCDLKSILKPHYVRVYLWKTPVAMYANIKNTRPEEIGTPKQAKGHCCFPVYYMDPETEQISSPPLLAEVHLVWNDWNEEVVSHELCHALIHRMRVLKPSVEEVMEQVKTTSKYGTAEEEICYEYSYWFSELYRWLWKVNPYGTEVKGT